MEDNNCRLMEKGKFKNSVISQEVFDGMDVDSRYRVIETISRINVSRTDSLRFKDRFICYMIALNVALVPAAYSKLNSPEVPEELKKMRHLQKTLSTVQDISVLSDKMPQIKKVFLESRIQEARSHIDSEVEKLSLPPASTVIANYEFANFRSVCESIFVGVMGMVLLGTVGKILGNYSRKAYARREEELLTTVLDEYQSSLTQVQQ